VEHAAGARGDVEELVIRDPDGIAIQIQDVGYSGGGGPLGDTWARAWTPAPAPVKPVIASRSINHITADDLGTTGLRSRPSSLPYRPGRLVSSWLQDRGLSASVTTVSECPDSTAQS
jgi:hypothetical protein